eukprot:SAG11_NODE_36528_length_261_cov_0.635802_2_plen_25_part_01
MERRKLCETCGLKQRSYGMPGDPGA